MKRYIGYMLVVIVGIILVAMGASLTHLLYQDIADNFMSAILMVVAMMTFGIYVFIFVVANNTSSNDGEDILDA